MSDEVVRKSWWHTGGPEDNGEPATEGQVKFMQAIFPRLQRLMSREELVFLELEGPDGFLSGLTKAQAMSYISRVKAWEKEQQDEANAKIKAVREEAAAMGVPEDQVIGKCGSCGGILLWEGQSSSRCLNCGARGFACRR